MMPPVSVILIRENAEQLTGSGCCGKLEGDNAQPGGSQIFQQTRRHQQQLGVLHRAVREFFPSIEGREQVSVVTVDPRNQFYLAPKLWYDVLLYRPGVRASLLTALQCFALPAVVVNGRIISRGGEPVHPEALCHLIRVLLGREIAVDASRVRGRIQSGR